MYNFLSQRLGRLLLAVVASCVALVFLVVEPQPQNIDYHLFADQRMVWGIPNFWNVVSNVPFFLVGIAGLTRQRNCQLLPDMQVAYALLFTGVLLVSFGSGYYHLNPNNSTLVWDRLPMTLGFMALLSIVIAEHMSPTIGKRLLLPLLVIGVASVLYWHYTELQGQGDLRLYGLVQFLPILLIPVILLLRQNEFVVSYGYWLLILSYAVAKLFEELDEALYAANGAIGGHSLKHLAAAIGVYLLLRYYQNRPNSLNRIRDPH